MNKYIELHGQQNIKIHSACFGCQPHPSSGVHKTVNYSLRYWSYFFVQLPPSNVANQPVAMFPLATLEGGSCTVPEAVVTVLCTPDDECG